VIASTTGIAAGLDPDQRRVVGCRDRTIRVVAPAGAGKTRTIVERVVDRLARGADPRRILVLTFDTSAAAAVGTRLKERAREEGVPIEGLRVATLNAFGYALLRHHAPDEHRPIVTGAERDAIAAEVRAALARRSPEHDDAVPRAEGRAWAELFARLKDALHDPRALELPVLAETLARQTPELLDECGRRGFARAVEAVGWLFLAYQRALDHRGRMDFDDQKLRACQVLRSDAAVRALLQRRYGEVVVDEFQDINRLDFELVRLLAARAALLVVGDDDQAIYAFRGCSPEWIIDLEARSGRRVTSLELRTNYRNPPNLLAAAVRLICRNRRRIPKRPVASRADDAAIELAPFASPARQAEAVVHRILAARRRDPRLGWRDMAVLYRMNAESRPIQAALREAGVPYVVREEDDETPGNRLSAVRHPSNGEAPDAVSLLTYFRAKGLQWPIVFLTSCNEGVAPHRKAPVEDERRLFYVAMTRASSALHALWLDPETHGPPSRFLREAGLLRR
jgi:DNA helicase-2/ATP-dependent DNA helicase PcrA